MLYTWRILFLLVLHMLSHLIDQFTLISLINRTAHSTYDGSYIIDLHEEGLITISPG